TLSKLTSHLRVFENSSCPRITAHDAYLIVNNLDPDAYNTALAAAIQCNCEDMGNHGTDCIRLQEQAVQAIARDVWAPTLVTSQETLGALRSVLSHLAKMPGDRVLLVASSGFYAGELQNLVDGVVNDALRSGIVINALDAKGLYTEDSGHGRVMDDVRPLSPAGMMRLRHEAESFGPSLFFASAPMTAFALGTGGQFFHDRNDLTAGYYSLAVAPETEYLLGFTPEKAKLNGALHKLKVEINAPGKYEVQARPGYFAQTKESSGPTAEERIDGEVRGSEERNDFPLSVSEQNQTASNGDRKLSVDMRVDIQKLPFERQNERHVDMLTFVAALFDAQGKMVSGEEAQTQLALKPETFERFSKNGLSVVTSLKAPPGAYGLRVVVEEALQGKLSATRKEVQIR
ncbi:MAG TPA: VWA domain-containing protein, partial [Candidatus Methylomirabilis sp.]|nr:VWA domain-containing protein [Candidatus Methylomirabilis sp.]